MSSVNPRSLNQLFSIRYVHCFERLVHWTQCSSLHLKVRQKYFFKIETFDEDFFKAWLKVIFYSLLLITSFKFLGWNMRSSFFAAQSRLVEILNFAVSVFLYTCIQNLLFPELPPWHFLSKPESHAFLFWLISLKLPSLWFLASALW